MLLRGAGHDVETVRDEGLTGASDDRLFEACVSEKRTLITLDRDFAQVPRFPPERSAGVVVLELGGPASISLLDARLRDFLALTRTRSVNGELWIVEPGRVRVHVARDD